MQKQQLSYQGKIVLAAVVKKKMIHPTKRTVKNHPGNQNQKRKIN
jgi:hypothetical protein